MANGKRLIKEVRSWGDTGPSHPYLVIDFCLIRVDPSNPWPEKSKTNAVQASHLDRIARECRACAFAALGGECAFAKPRSRRNARLCRTLQTLDRQILDSPIFTCSN
jgi:hypothetical protein